METKNIEGKLSPFFSRTIQENEKGNMTINISNNHVKILYMLVL